MQGRGLSLKIAVSFILTIGIPSSLIAGYTRYCASSASDLETSARRYEVKSRIMRVHVVATAIAEMTKAHVERMAT